MKHTVWFILGVMIAAVAGLGATPENPHQQLHEILQRPMYQAWRQRQKGEPVDINMTVPGGVKEWLRSVGRSIGDFLDWVFRSRSSSPSGFSIGAALPTILRVIAWGALAIALVVCAFFLFRFLAKNQPTIPIANVLSRKQVHQALESGDALAMDSAQWMEEAARLAAEQNFRAVYRALYLALLSGLHTRGKIEHSRNRTNWAYVQHYRGAPEERAMFADLTQLFDRVWYGRKDAGGNSLEQLRKQVAQLTAEGKAA